MVRAKEAPLDVVLPQTDVKDLAAGLGVGVIAVGSPRAVERQVGGHLRQQLGGRRAQDHGQGDGRCENKPIKWRAR